MNPCLSEAGLEAGSKKEQSLRLLANPAKQLITFQYEVVVTALKGDLKLCQNGKKNIHSSEMYNS